MSLTDLFFPRFCLSCRQKGCYICASCLSQVQPGKSSYYSADSPLYKTISLFHYDGVVRKAILGLKYRFASDIAEELSTVSINKLEQLEISAIRNSTLVPIPTTNKRKRIRGFNQTELIGKKIAESQNWLYLPELLVRAGTNTPQTGLKRTDRLTNIKNSFFLNTKYQIPDTNVVVFDDVFTTGATLTEAAKTLRKRGAKHILGLTIAR